MKFLGVFVKMLLFLVKFAIFLFNYTADIAKIKNEKNSDIFFKFVSRNGVENCPIYRECKREK